MQLIKVNKSTNLNRAELPYPILVAHQPEFMPWLGNISKAMMGDVYFILDTVQYCKEVFQNRNKIRIKSEKGWQWLNIPIVNGKRRLINWQEVEIDNSKNWKQKHLNAIQMSYSRSLHFNEIYNELCDIYNNFKGNKLIDFLLEFIKYAHKKFNVNVPIYRTSELIKLGYNITGQKSDLILNMCKVVNAKTFIFGEQGRNYIEKEKFDSIQYRFQNFKHPVYEQMHGDFISHMSFIDLLFNHGKNAVKILNKSDYDKE
jgi:hypothetical protein